ncbi:MAG: hypothetical protein JWN54_3776, partial [Mycobacterium sp.]|nr:hypothetical protein [Mycobacterium sp.]
MLDNEPTGGASADDTSAEQSTATATTAPRRRATRRAPKAAPIAGEPNQSAGTEVAAATDPATA